MEFWNAVGAECVPAVNKDARDAFSNVVFEAAELADIQATRLVVKLDDGVHFFWVVHN